MMMFDPISEICFCMLTFEPWPMAIMVMTDATPIIIPSMVRNALILLLMSARKAILKRFVKFISFCLIVVSLWEFCQCLCG